MAGFLFRIITVAGLCFAVLFSPFRSLFSKEITVDVNGSYSAVDSLGRSTVTASESKKEVGVFYFLWSGEHGIYGPYDITKITQEHPDAITSAENWEKYGGGYGSFSFWGEPLFGYYLARDTWVIRKHCQMLTDAGVDFVVFDTTNAHIYKDRAIDFISVWYEYYTEGYSVPKIAFYTNTESGKTMNAVYDEIYNNPELKEKYPRLSELWYRWNGRPMIIGDSGDAGLRSDVKSFFRIKANQWPTAARNEDGFPWIEFKRLHRFGSYYKNSFKDKSIMCVSCAQHCDTGSFSSTALYGNGNDHGRSWHKGAKDTGENAVLYGYNFAEQWEYAIKLNPDIIFVTGFNEWVAQRLQFKENEPIGFCDNCTPEYSRDFEPSAGVLGDNYYMQFVNYVAKFKRTTAKVPSGKNMTVDIDGPFDQWNDGRITAVYKDYCGDTADRDCQGFGNVYYTDASGRNDIITSKVVQDKDNVYFYVDTAENLTPADGGNWMTLFINVSGKNEGYEYVINRTAPENGKTSVEKIDKGNNFAEISQACIRYEGNRLMLKVCKADLGIKGSASFSFKWADGYRDASDVYSFYTTGDSAPYGRLNYRFG